MTYQRRGRLERHCYETGRHLLRLRRSNEGWTVTVDGMDVNCVFATEVEAWSRGLAIAEGLERALDPGRKRSGDRGAATTS